jgi:hypothetical protein
MRLLGHFPCIHAPCGARREARKGTEGTNTGSKLWHLGALLLRRGHIQGPYPPLSESQTPCWESGSLSSPCPKRQRARHAHFHLSMRLCGARRGHGKGTEGTDPGRGGALVRALLLRRGHMRDPRPPLSESQTPCCEERSISSCRGQKLWNSWGEANFARADAFQIALVAKRTP